MSMISEQVRELRERAVLYDGRLPNNAALKAMLRMAADTIEELNAKLQAANMERSSAYYNGGWIPCSERLPEEDKMSEYWESVIVTLDTGRVTEGRYDDRYEEWWVDAPDGEHYSINATGKVIAWMPLPEAWKGE